jgi:methionyl-tRNA formyltransferase
MRIIFMGTPEIAASALLEIIKSEHEVISCIIQPDRSKKISAVKQVALDNNINIYQPEKISSIKQEIYNLNPDLIITCAYGQFIPEEILNIPKYKSINLHASILPKYRGGAPIHWAIINGEEYTGWTVMYMIKKMDAGNIISQHKIRIDENDTFDSLYKKMSLFIKEIISNNINTWFNSSLESHIQDEKEVSFGLNIRKEDEHVDFNQDVKKVYNKIRGLNSIPGGYIIYNNKRIKLYDCSYTYKEIKESKTIVSNTKKGLEISCINGTILLTSIHIEAKKLYNYIINNNSNSFFKVGDKIE